ncbi:PREDICTED: uncharacterized protein LOC104609766 isoform X2 [Nelumbo nucifera]|uniref:Large ribosomal subunit protein bL32m n=1 Tax=Nelumbo nucifera TaxID=4432 RepID=A0A1U8B1F0_NELNU|nr:PREDICTED: uncharacterized protein LOC104609766 isoform X2 [Nelumbo nucifera]XP_010274537.1 PREDICTED: uncharacterized protein LOC104609766 isoform X2 [Nelumbo nucifera]
MAFMTNMFRNTTGSLGLRLGYKRWIHSVRSAPLERLIGSSTGAHCVLPEFNKDLESKLVIILPKFSFGASMDLMAVPKKKVSPHKKGIRNGPKALKPVPVIIRCKSCGRVKLPHFFCCSGIRETPGNKNDSSS